MSNPNLIEEIILYIIQTSFSSALIVRKKHRAGKKKKRFLMNILSGFSQHADNSNHTIMK